MFRWLSKPTSGFAPNDDINQYPNGVLTMAPINPVPVLSAVVAREAGTQAGRFANGQAPDPRSPWGGSGIPLPPWLSKVITAQDQARQLRFTPVPEYVKQDSQREAYLKYGDAVNKQIYANSRAVSHAVINSQSLGLGNNRR
jgi:hypothetical protein